MKNFTVLCSLFARSKSVVFCLSLYSVDSFWALICCCFVNYCLLYWFCWLISLIRLSAFLLLLSLFPGLWCFTCKSTKSVSFLLRYLLCLTLISPIAHSNISRGVREIFLYPIRGYSLGGKQILLLFPCLGSKTVSG